MSGEYPFSAVAGQEPAKRALLLACLNPAIGGVLLVGAKGSAKSVLAYSIKALFASRRFTVIPLHVTEERLLGQIGMEQFIQKGKLIREKGLLDTEPGEILYADDINLLRDSAINLLLESVSESQSEGRNGTTLIGTMNPQEGRLRPQLLERFGLCVTMDNMRKIEERRIVLERRIAYERTGGRFQDTYEKQEQELRKRLERAGTALDFVRIPKHQFQLAADLVQEGACQGNRTEILLLETARTIAALDGQAEVTEEAMKEAAAYVLPHRMGREMDVEEVVRESQTEEEREGREETADRMETSQSQKMPETTQTTPEEQKEETTSEEPLSIQPLQLQGETEIRKNYAGSGKRNRTTRNVKVGHMIRSLPKPEGELALCDTLREAAIHMRERRPPSGTMLKVREEDFRRQVKEGRTGATILFVVDASGSMGAKKRMRAVKGAVLSLLRDAYEKRDKVGIVIFRDAGAKVLLMPTRSVELAQKRLMTLPVGGKTPLADGLELGFRILAEEKSREKQVLQYLILLTDGKANSSFHGEDPASAARRMAEKIRREEIHTMVLDTENAHISLGLAKELANLMGSSYESLQNLSSKQIQNRTKEFIRRKR